MERLTNNYTNFNRFAVSTFAEPAINTAQTLDLTLLLGKGDIWKPEPITEMNDDESNGLIGPDLIYRRGQTGSMSWTLDRLRPSEAAIMMAYGLGEVSSVASGIGYEHTITERLLDVEQGARSLPTFTAMQELGRTVDLNRIYSMASVGGGITFTRGDWVKGTADFISTGKVDAAYSTEAVSGLDNATSITLASNAVDGSTAQERLNNVHSVMAYYNGAWRNLVPTAVSSATPAVITIPSLGGAGGTISYEVIYAATRPTWATFPSQLTEPPLQITNMCIWIGGTWDGSAFLGGYPLSRQLDSFDWKFTTNQEAMFSACAGGEYSGTIKRSSQAAHDITIAHDMYEVILEEWRKNGRYFGIWVLCEGAEFDTGQNYTVELVFPRCGIMRNDRSDNSGMLSNSSTIGVLADSTYGRVIAKVKNLWPQYAA